MLFFVKLNKTNEVKFWLTIYSYFDVSMIMVIIIKMTMIIMLLRNNIILPLTLQHIYIEFENIWKNIIIN